MILAYQTAGKKESHDPAGVGVAVGLVQSLA